MSTILDPIRKALKDQADHVGNDLLKGNFKDFVEAKVLVARRQSLLKAIDIVNEQTKREREDPDA